MQQEAKTAELFVLAYLVFLLVLGIFTFFAAFLKK